MKKGICYGNITAKGETLDRLAAVRQAGYDGVELTFSRPGQGPLSIESSQAETEALRDAIRALGLELPSTMCGAALQGCSLLDADPAARARGAEGLRLALARAAWLGADTVLIHPGHLQAAVRYDQAFDALVAVLRALVPACEATGVGVAVENVWNRFLLSPREMVELVDAAESPLVGAYFDVGNVLAFGYPEQWIAMLGGRIRKVHVKDFQRAVATGAGFCQLLDGDADYPAVMAALRQAGYDSYLTSEVSADMAETSARIDRILAM